MQFQNATSAKTVTFSLGLLLWTALFNLAIPTSSHAQSAEICDNGIDDDVDGLIDCEDEDCFFPLFSNYPLGNSNSNDVSLGDLDGDGDLDAWVANVSQANRVWINQGGAQGGVAGNFADSGQVLASHGSLDVSLGDLDGDGDLDAWVANYPSSQGNRVWINDGLGNFSDSGQALGNSYSTAVSLGDVDSDGDLDAWVANADQANRVWINDGFGNFVDSGQALGNSDSNGVALGDLDGDGDLDAWVANVSQANRVWINQGGDQGGVAGNFTDSGQALGNSSSSGVSIGDLDGDGDLDAWVTTDWDPQTSPGQANRVWINDGFGNFTDSGQALGNSNSNDVSLGDLDGDGDLDAWVANVSQANRVWINQGGDQGGVAGNFADSGQTLGNSYSTDVVLGDLDGDGDLDAWVANGSGGEPNLAWINQGGDQGGVAGNFADSVQALGNSNSWDVSLGDLDGDGDLDAWIANWTGDANRVWINQGGAQGGTAGNFLDNGQALGNSDSWGVSLGDLDGDGDLDAWVANLYSQANRVWTNDGFGNFTDSGQALGNSNSNDVSLGDLDGDGDLDAWVTNWDPQTSPGQANRVWVNQGGDQGGVAGNFADSGQALGNSDSLDVALGDVDGDGDLDAWVANGSSANANRVWINQGGDQGGVAGNFADSGQALGNSSSLEVALGDVDGDGDLDAWVANESNEADHVWINQGGDQGGVAGNFADSGQALGNSSSSGVSIGDLDGDGDLDAWVATRNSQTNRVWINQGGAQGGTAGDFTDSGQALGASSNAVSLGDLDDDGDLDAFTAIGYKANRVSMNLSPCAADIDGDGIPNICDIDQALGSDCDGNGTLDVCDLATGALDCDANGVPDTCQPDSDSDGTIDPCDDDLDGDGIPNACDIDQTAGTDCDLDGQDDGCQPDGDSDGQIDPCDTDLDNDGILNECDPDHASGEDCNSNGILDSCDIAGGSTDADGNGIPDECEETPFIRGDVNGDGGVDISDAITILDYLFTGGSITCDKAADSNDDAAINVADAIQLLGYLFSGTGDLPAPFPTCGVDPTADALECEIYGGCP